MDILWRKYQNALLLNRPPHACNVDVTESSAKYALSHDGGLFARWTSDYDCGHPTEWWYCIKDTFEELSQLTAKQRYRVNKGLKNCSVKLIKSQEVALYADEIFTTAVESFSDYPAQYRSIPKRDQFMAWLQDLSARPDIDIWICLDNATNKMCGYGYCCREDNFVHLSQVKVPTRWLNNEVNAALAFSMCEYYLHQLKLAYVCDGERNIRHITEYQSFLVRVLNFRYAYCHLNVVYNRWVGICVKICYPFSALFGWLGKHNHLFYNVYSLLRQEQICRSFKQ